MGGGSVAAPQEDMEEIDDEDDDEQDNINMLHDISDLRCDDYALLLGGSPVTTKAYEAEMILGWRWCGGITAGHGGKQRRTTVMSRLTSACCTVSLSNEATTMPPSSAAGQ